MASIKSMKELPRFDGAEYMKTEEDMAWFMADAMSTGDRLHVARLVVLRC